MSYPSDVSSDLEQLRGRFGTLADLDQAADLLAWDRHTYMPPAAGATRGRQSATLAAVMHEKLADPQVGSWLERLEEARLEPDDEALVRLCRREYEQSVRLPAGFVERLATAKSASQDAWLKAREVNDYRVFAPHLATMFELSREQAEHLGYEEHPYDALHHMYEPGSTARKLRTLFEQLRPPLSEVAAKVGGRGVEERDRLLYGQFDTQLQDEFVREQVERFGFDFERGRLDLTVHPFAQGIGRDDTRITTRYRSDFLATGLFAAFHEAGHGIYEQGLPDRWSRTPLGKAVSLGVHESQSRLWENLIARSLPFWRGSYSRLQSLFQDELGQSDVTAFHRAVNTVAPSLIRIEADEVTYNLHVIIRFELEMALIEGDLGAHDLPDAWNAAYSEYLGVEPPDDLSGCLQDVHWSLGLIGYFPTYALGNLISVQLFEALRSALPYVEERIEAGEYGGVLAWLRENVHVHGSRLEPEELLREATGSRLDPNPYLRYLESKFGSLRAEVETT